jgi:hypothetical protein
MGHGSFTPSDWDTFTTTKTAGKTTAHVFTARGIKETLDPSKITLRESVDGPDNPASTPICIFFDVTGSMGHIPDLFVREGMRTLFTEIYDRKPVSDPHILLGAIGDVVSDSAPLQVSQFEADIRIADQLTDVYLEGRGGANDCESYTLPWYFAAMKTVTDSVKKRNKKGYLFTIGDENPPAVLTAHQLESVFGPGQYTDLTSEQLLEMVEKSYNVFHVVVEEGSYCRGNATRVVEKWRKLLGQRVLPLSDHTKLSEVIVSAITQTEGNVDAATVSATWSGDTALVVQRAIGALTTDSAHGAKTGSVVSF